MGSGSGGIDKLVGTQQPRTKSFADIVREIKRRKSALSMVGANDVGQMGSGTINVSGSAAISTVTGMAGKYAPTALAAGADHAAFIARDGNVMVWGGGESGQLGVGESLTTSPRPYLLKGLRKDKACSVACGSEHTLVALQDGRVFAFGDGSVWGLLGTPTPSQSFEPVQVHGFPAGAGPACVFAGRVTSGAVFGDGSCFMWGCNSAGQLGMPISEGSAVEDIMVPTPTRVHVDPSLGEGSGRVIAAAAADFFTLFVVGSCRAALVAGCPVVSRALRGAVMGGDRSGLFDDAACSASCDADLGLRRVVESCLSGRDGAPTDEELAEISSDTLDAIVDVSAGDRHGCIVRGSGLVYMIGRGMFGLPRSASAVHHSSLCRHADEDEEADSAIGALWVASDTAVRVPSLGLEGVVSSSCGGAHTVVGTRTGRLIAFGASDVGQTGTGEFGWTLAPEACEALHVPLQHVEAFACGGKFTSAIHYTGARGDARERLIAFSFMDYWMRKALGRGIGETVYEDGEAEAAVDDLAAMVAAEAGMSHVVEQVVQEE
jgi:alpha-tubulin suppressor-like RCC1 family protein